MDKGKAAKAFDRDFDPSKNNTICYIHIQNTETAVFINRDGITFYLKFTIDGKIFQSKAIVIQNQNDYVYEDLSRIDFSGINLQKRDIENLADCIDRIINYYYD